MWLLKVADEHSGLGSWVGAIGAVLAIFATWGIADYSYRRDQREHVIQRRADIDLFGQIIDRLEVFLKPYISALQEGQEESMIGFSVRTLNAPERSAASDLAWVPVTQWPSLESFLLFKQYWFILNKIINASDDIRIAPTRDDQDIAAHDRLLKELRAALAAARGTSSGSRPKSVDRRIRQQSLLPLL